MKRTTRTKLGPHFSEAARRLWRVVETTYESSQARAAKELDAQPAQLSRWLYGDALPGLTRALALKAAHGIGPELWKIPPQKPFTLPAAREAA